MHDSLMTQEILFDYLRKNPKAKCRDAQHIRKKICEILEIKQED